MTRAIDDTYTFDRRPLGARGMDQLYDLRAADTRVRTTIERAGGHARLCEPRLNNWGPPSNARADTRGSARSGYTSGDHHRTCGRTRAALRAAAKQLGTVLSVTLNPEP